jgi:ParB family protein of integrating conjugative element (PFGI_1 class)
MANASDGGNRTNPSVRKPTVSEIRAVTAALAERAPANAATGIRLGEDYDGSQMPLSVDQIVPYDKNPRTGPNPRYLQIKESIRAQGVTNQLTVTRRPGMELYMPYGGGNTRLRIVQELLKETGEERWKKLTVKYRAWPGDAAVIAAHLVENEQRGDTTFWEKAHGIASLKQELENESNRVLTATEVNAEARRLGMDFGLQTVQNFLFAVEQLGPIGKWLQARDVQHAIKPAVVALTALCTRLGQKAITTRAAIDQCLTLVGDAIAQTGEEALDVEDLVRSLQQAVAESLGVNIAQLGTMLASLAGSPNLTAQQLRSAATAPTPPPPPPVSDRGADVGPTAGTRPSEPPVSRAAPSPAPRAPSPPETPAAQQLPLRPAMLAPVPPATAPAVPGTPVDRKALDPNVPSDLQQLIHLAVMDIGDVAELHDSVCNLGTMPLGYFMELPESMNMCGNRPVTDVLMRKSTWHVLAAVSGQFDAEVARRIPADQSRWGAVLARRDLGNQFTICTAGQVLEGRAYLDAADLLRVFHHSVLGPLFVELWDLALRMRQLVPHRFPDTWRPLSL